MKPNSFLIGVQKSATSSLYNWISQHPEICAPSSLKDIPFFSDDRLFSQGNGLFNEVYGKHFKGEKVVFHGNVNYIFFEKGLQRIKTYAPNAKFLMVIRNPVQRAISAYNFAVKRGIEKKDISAALKHEQIILKQGGFQEKSDLTYKEHGLYYKQLSVFENYFDLSQICIVEFEDLKTNPNKELTRIFEFFEVDPTFEPELKYLNETGAPRNNFINGLIYKESKIKTFFIKNVISKLFSFDFKVKTKLYLGKLMTKKIENKINAIPDDILHGLKSYYKSDIDNLEKKLGLDLEHWK